MERAYKRIFFVLAVLLLGLAVEARPLKHTLRGVRYQPLSCLPVLSNRALDPAASQEKPWTEADYKRLDNFTVVSWNLDGFGIAGHTGKNHLRDFSKDSESFKRWDSSIRFRSEAELKDIAGAIKEMDPTVLMLTEVNDIDSIIAFARDPKYLNGAYELYFRPSNQVNSSIGFLVKRNLPLKVQFESHRDAKKQLPDGRVVRLFTRDLPALILQAPGSNKTLVLMGIHAKSQRKGDRQSIPGSDSDPGFVQRRTGEFEGVIELQKMYRQRFGKDTAFMTMGDFNTDVRLAPEMKVLEPAGRGVLDLQAIPADAVERTTFTYHRENPRTGQHIETLLDQLDDIRVEQPLAPHFVSASVYRYKDKNGVEKRLPRTRGARDMNPSGHFPIRAVFNFLRYFFPAN